MTPPRTASATRPELEDLTPSQDAKGGKTVDEVLAEFSAWITALTNASKAKGEVQQEIARNLR
jgi:hypothetical protein